MDELLFRVANWQQVYKQKRIIDGSSRICSTWKLRWAEKKRIKWWYLWRRAGILRCHAVISIWAWRESNGPCKLCGGKPAGRVSLGSINSLKLSRLNSEYANYVKAMELAALRDRNKNFAFKSHGWSWIATEGVTPMRCQSWPEISIWHCMHC